MLGPWLHADDGHDADFVALVVHDASQHRLTADLSPFAGSAADQHCVACHFIRLIRHEAAVTLALEPEGLAAGPVVESFAAAAARVAGPPPPARAPPAVSL